MLDPATVDRYHQQGFIPCVDVMPCEEVSRLRSTLEAFEASQGGHLMPAQRSRAFLLFPWLDNLIRDPRVLDPVEQLIGPDILCWSTIFWIKEPGSASFVDWHQDNTYWGLSSQSVITAWFALSDASEEAGCMSVIPGTHLGQTLAHEDTYDENNMLTRGQRIPDLDRSRAVAMPLKAGQMSIHNYCLAHGSGPNRTTDRRMGVSMHFLSPDTRQVVGNWDCAALVRGQDRYGYFAHAPRPRRDLDPDCVGFHQRASDALREVLYFGAQKAAARL